MKLLRIRLRDYRGVRDSETEFSRGVTVVEGPNEAGKSSIAEAFWLIRAYKDSSRAKAVRQTLPIGKDVGPFVEVELQLGGAPVTYRKRWIKSPLTELHVGGDNPLQLVGDPAHDYFEELLSQSVDADLLTAMTIFQGQSLEQPKLAEITALQRALGDQDPAVRAGAENDHLLTRIDEEYSRFFTATGKINSTYRAILDTQRQLEEELETLRQQSADIDRDVEEHEEEQRKLAALEEKVLAARDERSRKELAFSQVEKARRAVEAADYAARNAEQVFETVRAQSEARTQLRESLSAAEEDLQREVKSLEAQRVQLDRAQENRRAAERAQLKRGAEQKEARQRFDQARNRLETQRSRIELERLEQLLANVEKQSDLLTEGEQEISQNPVDKEFLDRVNAAAVELQIATSAKMAAAAQLKVTQLGETAVMLRDEPLPAGVDAEVPITEPIKIEVPGVVCVDITPGQTETAAHKRELEAQEGLEALLRQVGAGDVEEVRGKHRRREKADGDRQVAQKSLELLLGDMDVPSLRAQIELLRATVARGSSVDDSSGLAPVGPQGYEADYDRRVLELATMDEALQRGADKAKAARAVEDAVRDQYVRSEETVKYSRSKRADLRQQLENAQELSSDADLRVALERASRQQIELRQIADEANAELEAMNPGGLSQELTDAEAILATMEQRRDAARQVVARLNGALDYWAAQGVHDRLGEVESAAEAARHAAERAQRSARAIQTLRQVMLKHKDAAQRKYVAPFKQRIERLGKVVFGPSFAVEVSPELEVASRTLDGVTVPFDSLSAGAREQVSLIGRLASAMLIDPDDGAPVILDDTMGFADSRRLEALNSVLTQVGGEAQIVVLTCQPDRFDSLGGAKFVRLEKAPPEVVPGGGT